MTKGGEIMNKLQKVLYYLLVLPNARKVQKVFATGGYKKPLKEIIHDCVVEWNPKEGYIISQRLFRIEKLNSMIDENVKAWDV